LPSRRAGQYRTHIHVVESSRQAGRAGEARADTDRRCWSSFTCAPIRPETSTDRYRAAEVSTTAAAETMPPIDFVICGSVAVNADGVRIGKGAGYTDFEVALLVEHGFLRPETVIATTVHEAQVLDTPLPCRPDAFTPDYVVRRSG
jgi:5-formyltetrahydrofolate cyclo-ligase